MTSNIQGKPEVRIVWFSTTNKEADEQRIAELLAQGFKMVLGGGGAEYVPEDGVHVGTGFVIMQKGGEQG